MYYCIMLYFFRLFIEDNENRRDTSYFEVGQIRQLPIYCAVSPADAEYHRVGLFSLLLGELHGDDMISLFYRPVDVGIIGF